MIDYSLANVNIIELPIDRNDTRVAIMGSVSSGIFEFSNVTFVSRTLLSGENTLSDALYTHLAQGKAKGK